MAERSHSKEEIDRTLTYANRAALDAIDANAVDELMRCVVEACSATPR
jgi:hypothetical protein